MTTTSEQQAVPVAQELDETTPGFLIDLASRIHAKTTPAMGFDGYDVDQLIAIARALAEPARLAPIEGVAASGEYEQCSFCQSAATTSVADESDFFAACPTCAIAWIANPGFASTASPSPAIPEGTSGEGGGAQGYVEAEAMLRDLILPTQISDTAIRVARDHMMQFVRLSYPWKPVEGLEGVEDARKWVAARCDSADQSGARSITINTAVLRLAFPEPDATQTREAEGVEPDWAAIRAAVAKAAWPSAGLVDEAMTTIRAALSAGAAKGEVR